jgi:hypothetical protein
VAVRGADEDDCSATVDPGRDCSGGVSGHGGRMRPGETCGSRGPCSGGRLAIPGCASEGETLEELLENVHEAVEGCLSFDVRGLTLKQSDRVLEIAV